MQAPAEITPWHWAIFTGCVLIFLTLDLAVFHRSGREIKFKDSLFWTLSLALLALLFTGLVAYWRGRHEAAQFLTAYFVEISLSLDNVFVIALVFLHFQVPPAHQHRVLFWGVLGALIMRGVMIGVGVALISRYEWLLYVFGAFLMLTGTKMLLSKAEGAKPEKSVVLRVARRFLPISKKFDGDRLQTIENGRRMLTPLFLVLLVVEASDVVFATDSIPAIFGVTRNAFIVFTSNVFAILGLRSLYSVLSKAIGLFRYLKVGLSVILMFIGIKLLIDPHDKPPRWFQYDIPDFASLLVVVLIVVASILVSVLAGDRRKAAS